MVVTKIYTEPPVCKKEILRYAGCRPVASAKAAITEDQKPEQSQLEELLEETLAEVLPKLSYKVCYIEFPLSISGKCCDFGCMKTDSADLAKNLQGCERGILFAATIGVEIDRLIARYTHISPAKAVILQAIGAERIESLCDVFCADVVNRLVNVSSSGQDKAQENGNTGRSTLRPRFSPGYGDLPLDVQKDIFQVLNCSKNIGLSLNDSLLMSPSKSVTAFAGIETISVSDLGNNERNNEEKIHHCANCKKTDCAYKR